MPESDISGVQDVTSPRVVAENLTKVFVTKRNAFGLPARRLTAVRGVSFELRQGEIYALVGGSGSGKSTVARLLTRLEKSDTGRVLVNGTDWTLLRRSALQKQRRAMQMVFQNPYASLDPTSMVVHLVGEPMIIHEKLARRDLDARVRALLDDVGLPSDSLHKYPHEFSGGQRQRLAIARALAADPDVIIADEAVSALDVSSQAKVLNLLLRLRRERSLTILFITHDLGVVRQVADRIGVLSEGELVEEAQADALFDEPTHEYTRTLLRSVPIMGRWR
ncbi:peptide/nickel transport system ATP-binding protein [Tamaricihabitans halophyticus]|uniref:Peptide/nickel transport system ATP-binding protein n=1 Tax=Tamaricihabitans halophyticus TaxID=1262583 RepID=A0A4R2Q877_9PSEU|nr:ATP-binding cassette domain-containing protein [Tamaricihabitans halophyticus]TCP45052.1 peptide/nickel transport system ATP-binding protein [Tamaricihabitans halophyticus]